MASTQQNVIDNLEKTIRKTEGLLVEEMKKNQVLAEEHTALSSTFEDLSIRYDSISIDFEKLSNDYLKRDQELESLKESYDDLKKENTSLFAEQTETFPDEFVPPCLKCLERSNADSTAETSAAAERNATTIMLKLTPLPRNMLLFLMKIPD